MNPSTSELSPWVSSGPNEKYEDTLIGNRRGLEALRKHIDEALEHGHSEIGDSRLEWLKISVVEEDPRIEDERAGFKGWLFFLVAIIIFLAGVFQVFKWLK